MDIEKKQLDRLVRIIALLKAKLYPNCENLASEMSQNSPCSAKIIKQDIKVLRAEFNAPIEYDFRKKGYFLANPDWEFSCVSRTDYSFSPKESSIASEGKKCAINYTIVFFIIAIGVFIPFAYSNLKLNNLEHGLKAYKEKSFPEAVSYFRKAASEGAPYAQFMLGECYFNGYGVDKNPLEAYKWYCQAEKNNCDEARERIVDFIIDPDNLIMDKSEAIEICGREAENGYKNAQYKLGLLFSQLSEQEFAFKWFKYAAEQGHPDAQYKLGDCYENAKGVGKDFTEAYYWYQEAAAQGIKNAEQAMVRVKIAENREKQNIPYKEETVKKQDDTNSVKNTRDYSQRKTASSTSDPWDPLTWRREEEIDEAKYGYDKAPYKCRRCGMRSFDPLDDGIRGVDGYCIDCIYYVYSRMLP